MSDLTPPRAGGADESLATFPVAQVQEFFVTLGKALRAFQLYDENNPVYQRFVQALESAFRELWNEMDGLHVTVEESRLLVEGEEVYNNPTRSESLAFLLFKDGIRSLTFREGMETETKSFLRILNQARLARADGDDLITLLWEADLAHLRYRHVDILAEGVALPEPGPGHSAGELQAVLEAEKPDEGEEVGQEGAPDEAAPQTLNREDFNPTLYNLDAREMEQIRLAVDQEMERDIRGEVLNALFDRLEEPRPARQTEILGLLSTLVPALLARGELAAATQVLSELRTVEGRDGVLSPEHRQAVSRLLDRLSSPETVHELVQALEDGAIAPSPRLLGGFLGYLRVNALPVLLKASEETSVRELQPVLREAVAVIAQRNRTALVSLLEAQDPVVVSGALRLAGQMQVREVAPHLSDLLFHQDAGVRRATVETIYRLKATTLAGTLQDVLLDNEAGVRVAAARVLEAMRYRSAAPRFREIIQSREIRKADLSEQIAMFEAYGSIGDPQAVELLDRYLNGKGFLGRREPSEIRACAALALGKVGSPEARTSLTRAATEEDPVVRNAVGKALRGGQGGGS